MLRLPVFLSLLGNAAAIDIWLRWFGGGNVVCYGIAQNTCCGVMGISGNPFWGIDFQAIPHNWNIGVRGHGGDQCGPIVEFQTQVWQFRCVSFRDELEVDVVQWEFRIVWRRTVGTTRTSNVPPHVADWREHVDNTDRYGRVQILYNPAGYIPRVARPTGSCILRATLLVATITAGFLDIHT
jgi:hypothetical protein